MPARFFAWMSRQITMRWRGLRVSPLDGQTGSQKPHSMHLSTISSAAGKGLRCLRWICGSSLSTTSGLRMPLGSSRRLSCHISW
ncbi:hypothetical protein D3C78_1103820 [compost metagenome]